MIRSMYPFWSAVIAALLAQCLKPVIYFGLHRKWKLSLHSALVTALSLSVGLQERFSSTLFAVTLALAVIVVYDAANVRYYAGQNIRLTKQLARDVQEHLNTEFENPVYNIKLKDVLGHRWIEVFGGITLGCIVALMIHYLL